MSRGHVINYVKGEEIVWKFCGNKLQKKKKKEFRIEKVIKEKDDKFYVKWKGYANLFNSWVDEKDSINEWIFLRLEIFRKSKS